MAYKQEERIPPGSIGALILLAIFAVALVMGSLKAERIERAEPPAPAVADG